jgi:uncharacterized membrane protein
MQFIFCGGLVLQYVVYKICSVLPFFGSRFLLLYIATFYRSDHAHRLDEAGSASTMNRSNQQARLSSGRNGRQFVWSGPNFEAWRRKVSLLFPGRIK